MFFCKKKFCECYTKEVETFTNLISINTMAAKKARKVAKKVKKTTKRKAVKKTKKTSKRK